MTSKLLEQKRLQAEIRKRDKEIPLEEQFKAIAEDAMTQSRTQEKPLANDIEETKLQKESKFLQKAKEIKELKRQASIPLAHRFRPKSLDDFWSREISRENGALRNIIQADIIPSFCFGVFLE